MGRGCDQATRYPMMVDDKGVCCSGKGLKGIVLLQARTPSVGLASCRSRLHQACPQEDCTLQLGCAAVEGQSWSLTLLSASFLASERIFWIVRPKCAVALSTAMLPTSSSAFACAHARHTAHTHAHEKCTEICSACSSAIRYNASGPQNLSCPYLRCTVRK